MGNKETTKVGQGEGKAEAAKADKPVKAPKPVFDIKTATDADGKAIPLDDNGRMTGVPFNYDGKVFQGLPRTVFADRGTFLDFRATLIDVRIAQLQEQKSNILEQAKEAREGVDPTKVKLRKLEKLQRMAAELEAQLQAEGIEV